MKNELTTNNNLTIQNDLFEHSVQCLEKSANFNSITFTKKIEGRSVELGFNHLKVKYTSPTVKYSITFSELE